MPTIAVDGVGLVALDVPPVRVEYQFKLQFTDAVAVKGEAISVVQKAKLLTIGAVGNGLTVTMISDLDPSQPVAEIV